MMDNQANNSYNFFSDLCLTNAKDALRGASILKGQKLNHIAYHLCVLCLEEIGKIIVGHNELESLDKGEKSKAAIDNHVKKLFWAVWGPTIGQEHITKEQFEGNKKMASLLHNRRLQTLYTELKDQCAAADKIPDDELETIYDFAFARLKLAETDGGYFDPNESDDSLKWFLEASGKDDQQQAIFGEFGQNKLVELGDIKSWIDWLYQRDKDEQAMLINVASSELKREVPSGQVSLKPKWKVKCKFSIPSHAVRQNILTVFNEKSSIVKLNKGDGKHTLMVEFIFGDHIPVNGLWNESLLSMKLFVAALNVGCGGFIYWNIPTDLEHFYETITDLDTNKRLVLTPVPTMSINWEAKKMVLTEENLILSNFTFQYFTRANNIAVAREVTKYMNALALMAKNDIHLRFDVHIFQEFYECFINLIKIHHPDITLEIDIVSVGYQQLKGLYKDPTPYEKIMAIGQNKSYSNKNGQSLITLTDVLAIKQYCDAYLLTLAIRHHSKKDLF